MLNVLQVMPLIRRKSANLNTCERGIPAWRIVGTAFPRMVDADEPAACGIPRGGEVAMPRDDTREEIGDPPLEFVVATGSRDRQDPLQRQRVDRWLNQTRRRWSTRCQRRGV